MVDEMVSNWSSNGQETVKIGRKWSPNGHEMDHFNTFVVRPENVVAKEMVVPRALGRVVRAPPS